MEKVNLDVSKFYERYTATKPIGKDSFKIKVRALIDDFVSSEAEPSN